MTDETTLLQLVERIRTKPLELNQVAEIYGCSPRRVSELLKSIPGVIYVGRRVRIPLIECPPEYLRECGYLNSDKLSQWLQAGRMFNTESSASGNVRQEE